MKQSVLVLGAHGFIGRSVVACLDQSDIATPILGVRDSARMGSGAQPHENRSVDAVQPDSIAAALAGVHCVVNCVAGDTRTLVGSAQAIVEAVRRSGQPIRVVHLSTMSVYGSTVGLVNESAPLRADLGPYSQAKVAAEQMMAAYPHAVVLRPGCVFGPGSEQWTVRYARLLMAHRLGDLGAAGDGQCNLVYVNDVARAVVCAIRDAQADGNSFNLATPEILSWNDFMTRFAIALGAVPVRRIGGRRLKIESKLLAPPLKIMEIVGGKLGVRRLPPPIPPSLLRLMTQDIRLDTLRAQNDLGVRFTGVEQMLAETAHWYQEQAQR